jgi:CRISPR-associated endonuclease Csn1
VDEFTQTRLYVKRMKELSYRLGLDMGVTSVGWAVVDLKNRFIDTGVRIFPAAFDAYNTPKEKHPNQDRRQARCLRRRIRRKAERKQLIRESLTKLGWIPQEPGALAQWEAQDVYHLRHRALETKISLPELARIILHLNQRRGFLSLRKSEEANADKETQGLLGQISEIAAKIESSGHQTLGNYLYHLYQKEGIRARLRNHPFGRDLLYREFDLIWKKQATYHAELTDALRYGSQVSRGDKAYKVIKPKPLPKGKTLLETYGIENMTFFQRSVYWPEDSIGPCELELGEKRAPIADRRYQEFRLLQEVNNLKVTDTGLPGTPEERPLTEEERQRAIEFLMGKDKPKLSDLKTAIFGIRTGKKIQKVAEGRYKFNLEEAGRETISGMQTDVELSKPKHYGKDWYELPEATKNAIVDILTHPSYTDEDIQTELKKISGLSDSAIDGLQRASLRTGYGHLSVKALEKLIPFMREGRLYMHKEYARSAMAAAGYQRPDERHHDTSELLPRLEDLTNPRSPDYDPHQTPISSPTVLRSLTELRKIVNALIRKYGKPQRIHIEMARDLKMSGRKREDYNKRIRGYEKERAAAVKILEEYNVVPTRDAIQLVQLWQQQGEMCPYSGRTIGIKQLLGGSGEIDIDHIYPFSRSADDSLDNKVVCLVTENRRKGDRTPFEWLATADEEKFEQVLQRTKHYPRGKAKRFYAKEIPEGFANRDLNDTAWMAVAARQYLERLYPPRTNLVQGTKGTHTALLREHWGLHSMLRSDGIDLKNRDDHRHHALDAVLIALCDQTIIKLLLANQKFEMNFTKAKEDDKYIYHLRHTGEKIAPPWENFRSQLKESLNAIWVSHRPRRKVSGQLHKETNYGKTADGLLVVRKRVQDLSAKEVEGIRDKAIRSLILEYIRAHGGDIAALKAIPENDPLCMPSGMEVRKVRTAIPYAHITIRPGTPHETHVQSAATHHVAIFSLGEGKHEFVPVTLYEATRRKNAKEPILQKTYPGQPPEAEFLFHLSPGDSIMAEIDGKEELFIYNTIASTTGQIRLCHHTDARPSTGNEQNPPRKLFTSTPNTFAQNFPKVRKVNVLPLGEIRSSN